MPETERCFEMAASDYRNAAGHLLDAENSLRLLQDRLNKSLERLGKLRRNETIFAEIEEILRRNRTNAAASLHRVES